MSARPRPARPWLATAAGRPGKEAGYALVVCSKSYELFLHGSPSPTSVTSVRRFTLDRPIPLNRATRVSVTARGATLEFGRDGGKVGPVSDATFAVGRVVLGIFPQATGDPPYQVSFANVDIAGVKA